MTQTPQNANAPGVVYEVNITVSADLHDEYLAWLEQHIEEMLGLPGFEQAVVLENLDHDDPQSYRCTVHYVLRSKEDLQAYFDNHAERMRGQGIERFGDSMSATRRILTTTDDYFTGAHGRVIRRPPLSSRKST